MSGHGWLKILIVLCIFAIGVRIGIDYTVKHQRIYDRGNSYCVEINNESYYYSKETDINE